MSILNDAIEKAELRAQGLDLEALVEQARDKTPKQLATADAKVERRAMLDETAGEKIGRQIFERIIAGDDLQPINYLPRGYVAARPVCRITIVGVSGFATGFLIAPGVLVTNNHVFPTAESARRSIAEFDVELNVFDKPMTQQSFGLDPGRLFLTSTDLDFSIVAVQPTSHTGASLAQYGFLPLVKSTGKAIEGEWLTIIQHPAGQPKQVCIRENKLLKRADDVLWYATDTLGGSSGSPVFNNSWQVVALHHSGLPDTKNGRIQTIDGRDYSPPRDKESDIKWIANEGIRISRIVDELQRLAPDEPLLKPVFEMTIETAQNLIDGFALKLTQHAADWARGAGSADLPHQHIQTLQPKPEKAETAMASRTITVSLNVDSDGRVTISQPDRGAESFFSEAVSATTASAKARVEYDVEFDTNYEKTGNRNGYNAGFLGAGFEVPLPDTSRIKDEILEVDKKYTTRDNVLEYFGYSVVMHKTRKIALYSAANVRGDQRYKIGRPTDVWRFDGRIPRSAQIGDYYYANNKFDRGHLTRYLDMEYGETQRKALSTAADTLHFTNCAPQHAKFNQTRDHWQGIEQHILEKSAMHTETSNGFAMQVFTGPVLSEGDPVWERFKDIKYPVKYWKIAIARAATNEKKEKLFAAGFILDQSGVIADFGIESTVETPFTDFKLFQTPIDEIERLTGLSFRTGAKSPYKPLSDADPLRSGTAARVAYQARVKTTESTFGPVFLPSGYVPLESLEDIVGL